MTPPLRLDADEPFVDPPEPPPRQLLPGGGRAAD
jgi:hypothetical protein